MFRPTFVIAVCFASGVSLSGCESIKENTNSVLGAATASLGCAALAKLSGSNDAQALAAGVVCGSVGYAVTKKMEDDRKKYASNEQFYRGESKRLKKYNIALSKKIRLSEADLEKSKRTINTLKRKSNQSSKERAQLVTLSKNLKSRKDALSKELTVAKENRDYQKGLTIEMKKASGKANKAAETQLAALEASVRGLNELIGEHEQQTASLGAYL